MITEAATTNIKIGEKKFVLIHREFTDELEIEELLRINIEKLALEAITFPVIVNRLGFLLADANNQVKEREVDMEIFLSKKREEVRQSLNDNKLAGEKLTQEDIKFKQEFLVRNDPHYKVKTKQLNDAIRTRDYVNSIFWAAKDKNSKIDLLLKNEQFSFESLIDSGLKRANMNGVEIKERKNLIQ